MPDYYDEDGNKHTLSDWPGTSYKAQVINNAYRTGNFFVESVRGQQLVFFRCAWCGYPVSSSGVEGDHVVNQQMGRAPKRKSQGKHDIDYKEIRGLFEDAEGWENDDGSAWNLVLSCSECNGGSRNRKRRATRSTYRGDRDNQGPQGGSGIGVA
ncbi:hypothetical protein thsps21_00730 [Pseudomonas sp. No.21]|uniref:HNH endonuclease n=1 Tax=Pseudomonas tohonis TaxID=2725477 RepID=UPI001F23535C|nr:HNH endonuclease signature motif containing protein [Pseudomonas tohonis]GJN50054.1 hypothetical protein TUM20249_60400 [Pseudomonas tohonis]